MLTGSFPCASAVMVLQPPMSQNVSLGQQVKFTCATADNSTSTIISWNTKPDIGPYTPPNTKYLLGGGKISELMINTSNTAPNITVECFIANVSTGFSKKTEAQLLVQGMEVIIIDICAEGLHVLNPN